VDCPSCKAVVLDDARFCHRCGAALSALCRECGWANPPGASFCAGCGAALPGARPSPSPGRMPPADAEQRQVTVMFSDLAGSAALSARLEPERLRRVLSRYHEAVAAVIRRFDGHVAKFLGDGVLAFFGWPGAHEDDAERAVRAGLEIVEAIGVLEPDLRLQARIGISTGLVVAAEVGGAGHEVVGEPPNRAARLQALAEPDSVVIGPRTRRLLGDLFEYADLGVHPIKGFDDPVQVWQVRRPRRTTERFAALHGAALAPLVGREHEIGLLLARWEQAREDEGQLVLLSGEPGIGKSRIVETLRQRLADRIHGELRYQCLPYFQSSPLHPVIEELELAAGIARDDDAAVKRDKLDAHLLPLGLAKGEVFELLAELLAIPQSGRAIALEPNPQVKKTRILDALMARFSALARRMPLLVVVEDAHWLDPTSRELVERMVDAVAGVRALIVLTSRPDVAPLRTGRANVTALALNRLGRRQARLLVEAIAADRRLPVATVEQIVARTDGVPLFIEELTKTLLEAARPGDGVDVAPAPTIPETLQDSLMARLDRVAATREVAQIAATIGREVDYDLLAAVAGLPEDELRRALDQLVAAELLFVRGEPPAAVYGFKHALVQEAAYRGLLRERRAQLHERIAHVLAADFPHVLATNPELIAHHCTEAGLDEEAVEFWREAGETALSRGAPQEATTHLENALRLLERFPDSVPRKRTELGLLTALGGVLIAARGFAAAETGRTFERAWGLARELDDYAARFPVLFGRWIFHIARAEVDEAQGEAEAMLQLAELRDDQVARLVAHRTLANSRFFQGDLAATESHAGQVLELYDRARHASLAAQYAGDPAVVCSFFLAHARLRRGFPEQARALAERGLSEARAAGHLVTLAHGLHHGCLFHLLYRAPAIVLPLADELVELATHFGLPFWRALGQIFRGAARVEGGEAARGLAELRAGLDAYRATSGRLYLPYALAWLGEAARAAGEPQAGLGAIAEARELIEATGVRGFEAHVHRIGGRLRLALPEPDAAAEADLRRAMEVAAAQDARLSELRAATDLAALWCERGEAGRARALLGPLHARFTEGFEIADLRDARRLLDAL